MAETPSGPTDGFAFIAFADPTPGRLGAIFAQHGIPEVARWRRHRDVRQYRQGQIVFLVDERPDGFAARFGQAHGPCVYGLGLRVVDAARAIERLTAAGASPVEAAPDELPLPAIEGVGGLRLYLADRALEATVLQDEFETRLDFEAVMRSADVGLADIDHVTHNLERGGIARWRSFYERFFGFRELRSFDIEGRMTGLVSTAMVSPCGKIRIPLNESKGLVDEPDQVEEFLQTYGGEGIQHIALASDDLVATVDELAGRGVALQDTPDTYFDGVDGRLPGHGLRIDDLRRRRILVDGRVGAGPARLLLQIFGQPIIGPVFFEFIERRGDDGFGEGNFKALFESLELDQVRRGVLSAEPR